MSIKSLLLLLIGIAIVVFVGLNWPAMSAPTNLELGFMEVNAPLGVVLLGLMALLSVVFVALIAYTQGTVLVEARRHAKELAAQRELADKAEASRFTDLRAHLDKEVSRLSEVIENHTRETLARVDRAEMGLRERPVDADIARLVHAVENHNRDLHSRIDRLEMGLRERPMDADIARLVHAVENHNRDLHSRVDRLEMGLREGLAGYIPAPPTVQPAVLTTGQPVGASSSNAPSHSGDADPVGQAVPR